LVNKRLQNEEALPGMMNLERRWMVKRTRGGRKGYLAGHGTKPQKEGKEKRGGHRGKGWRVDYGCGAGGAPGHNKEGTHSWP
jgi:hypothetical protein